MILRIAFIFLWLGPIGAMAQDLRVVTVERPPFSSKEAGLFDGFSIELWRAVADDLSLGYSVERMDSFPDMLDAVVDGRADAAVANISITAERERVMDFSHSIFDGGLQIMVPTGGSNIHLISTIFSRDLLLAIGIAFLLLFCGGMVMWRLERNAQSYFDRPVRQAMFPAFWWALNLVVNGGFEERMPRTFLGRIFGVILVLSSLFVVSIFVAKITAVLTVDAIQGSVNSVNDLHGKTVGTIQGSTSARYLERREIDFTGHADLMELLDEFERGGLDAVVFDAPILAHYVNSNGAGTGQLIGQTFLRESYGFALPSQSPLIEDINQSLLNLKETGRYDEIYRKYFGRRK